MHKCDNRTCPHFYDLDKCNPITKIWRSCRYKSKIYGFLFNLLSLNFIFLKNIKKKELKKHLCDDCIKENQAVNERIIKILANVDDINKEIGLNKSLEKIRKQCENILLILRTRG